MCSSRTFPTLTFLVAKESTDNAMHRKRRSGEWCGQCLRHDETVTTREPILERSAMIGPFGKIICSSYLFFFSSLNGGGGPALKVAPRVLERSKPSRIRRIDCSLRVFQLLIPQVFEHDSIHMSRTT